MRAQALSVRKLMAAGSVRSSIILDLEPSLRQFRAEFDEIRVLPGIGPYAQGQLGNGTLNVAAEFNAMITAIDNTIAWIRANFPIGNGFLQAQIWSSSGRTDRMFSSAETAGLRAQLDALIATVE